MKQRSIDLLVAESHNRAMRRAPRVNQFSRSLLVEWRKLRLPVSHETFVVGVSGGADSTALLLALHELKSSPRLR